ncbi:MAG: acyltransferase family protein [Pseudomonadota bacterium]
MTTAPTHRREIDGLRALAVTAVIVNHFDRDLLPGGFLGVDIFFVISGFVITSSLAAHRAAGLSDLLLDFYVRRIKRLAPALLLCVVVTGVLVCLFNPDPRESLGTGIASLFGVSNIFLFNRATNYFADAVQLNVFSHTWSLGVEEQFYVAFPILVWVTGFARTPLGATRLLAVLGLAGAASLALFVRADPRHAYFLVQYRVWELALGAATFVLTHKPGIRIVNLIQHIPCCLLLVLLCAVLFAPSDLSKPATAAAVLLTALVVACSGDKRFGANILSSRPAVYIGTISYSLYLWHWSVLSLSRWTVGIHWWTVPVQVALMFALAGATYQYVERPLRRASWSPQRWRSIAYGVCSLLLAAGLLSALQEPLHGKLFAGKRPSLVLNGVESLQTAYATPDGAHHWKGPPCLLADDRDLGKKIRIPDCTLGSYDVAARRVLVLGNSFAAAFVPAFDDLVVKDGYAVTVASAWGASAVPQIANSSPWKATNQYYWNEIVPDLVSQLRPGDLVFLVSDLAKLAPAVATAESERTFTQLQSGLAQLSTQLAARQVRLAVLHGNPFARDAGCEPTAAMQQWYAPSGGRCKFLSKEITVKRRAPLDAVLNRVSQQTGVITVDLLDVFCPGAICTYEGAQGETLYRDIFSHPSLEGARLAAPVIRQALLRQSNR